MNELCMTQLIKGCKKLHTVKHNDTDSCRLAFVTKPIQCLQTAPANERVHE